MTMSDPSKKLLDLQERQTSGELIPCPRCGRMGMKNPLERNALSRYAVLYICDECGMTEAMLAMMHSPLPLDQWALLSETEPHLPIKAQEAKK